MSVSDDPLGPLEAPLQSVAQRDYQKLPRVRDLGRTILRILERITGAEGTDAQVLAVTARLAPLFEDLDAMPLPVRRERIERALAILADYRQGRLWDGEEEPAASEIQGPAAVPAVEAVSGEPAPRELLLAAEKGGDEVPDIARVLKELGTEVTYVKGVGPKMALLLERLGIRTVEDLLWHLPARYEDRRHLRPISELEPGTMGVARGIISGMGRAGRRVFEAILSDDSGVVLQLKWFNFNEKRLREQLQKGAEVVVAGEIKRYHGHLEMHHPDIDFVGGDEPGVPDAIVPVYPLTEGLHNKRIRSIQHNALDKFGRYLMDGIPPDLLGERLPSLAAAVAELHRPGAENDAGRLNARVSLYHRRVRLHEALFLQLGLLRMKASRASGKATPFSARPALLEEFVKNLPFGLTRAQERVISEIGRDLSVSHPMNRLLQGDVGSGKTAVAAAAAAIAVSGKTQVALMAPTEILAEQHYASLCKLLGNVKGHDFRIALLTGSQKVSNISVQPGRVLQDIADGKTDVVVGTHALIQESVQFSNLALVIIDEQHRFGVAQRAELRQKGQDPHVLVMTATPIPRTLTLTVYGDLEVSLLDEMPPGRTPIETRLFREKHRREVWRRVEEQLREGRQAYVVYPLVQESEKIDLRDAVAGAEELQNHVFPDFKIGIVHGKMKSDEKDAVLSKFRAGEIHLLVSTTVIEVGIDVPNATVMVIEHAERFGLSQLHQLRGRVGRGSQKSYCFLLASAGVKGDAQTRLQVLENLSDGFRIAEEDLRLRGPGEFMGTRQSGLPDFRVLDLVRDRRLIEAARQAAVRMLEGDPRLTAAEHRSLQRFLEHHWQSRGRFLQVG